MSIKSNLLRDIQGLKRFFEEYRKSGNPINYILFSGSYNNDYDVSSKQGSWSCKESQEWYNQGVTKRSAPSSQYFRNMKLTEKEIDEMLHLYSLENYQSSVKPKPLSEEDLELLFSMSKSHNITLLQKNSTLELHVDSDIHVMPTHPTIQTRLTPTNADYYIKHESQNLNTDIRSQYLPKVDILRYSCDGDYVNLPNKTRNPLQVSNAGSQLLQLSPSQYETYIKLDPKYLHQHKYITVRRMDVVADIYKYLQDFYSHTYESDYSFSLDKGIMFIKQKGVGGLSLIPEIISQLRPEIKSALYTPTSVTSITVELDEIKKIIEQFNIPLKVEFTY